MVYFFNLNKNENNNFLSIFCLMMRKKENKFKIIYNSFTFKLYIDI